MPASSPMVAVRRQAFVQRGDVAGASRLAMVAAHRQASAWREIAIRRAWEGGREPCSSAGQRGTGHGGGNGAEGSAMERERKERGDERKKKARGILVPKF